MNAALTLARIPTVTRPRPVHALPRVIWLVLLCAVPTTGLLALGHATLAASVFWGLFALLAVVLVLAGKPETLLAFALGVIPFMNLLRGMSFAFYNITIIVLALVIGFHAVLARDDIGQVWRRSRPLRWLALLVAGYYVASLFNTRDYSRNLRMFELLLVVVGVLLVGRNRALLASALRGLIIAACAVGVGLLPHNEGIGRLGIAAMDGQMLGNPVQLGMALALGLLVLSVDRAWWVALVSSRCWRWALLVPTAGLLLLTTSRAAWLVAVTGMMVALLFGRRQRARLLLVAGLAGMVGLAAWFSPVGPMLQAGVERTFNTDRSLRQRTSGRSDQWQVAYKAVNASTPRALLGYGPGRGPEVYARYSEEVEGVRYGVGRQAALHSLFMQVIVEAGLIGLLVLVVWLTATGVMLLRWTLTDGRVLPMICFVAYLLVIFTVSGNDTISGAALGLGLLPTTQKRRPREGR